MNRRLQRLLDQLEPELRAAFAAAVSDIKSKALIGALITALSAGDVEAAIEAVGVHPAAFNRFEGAIAQAYLAGGTAAIAGDFPSALGRGAGVVIRFDQRNPRAERWLAENSAGLVTRIVGEQRALIRETMRQGMVDGTNPRQVAVDIVGRLNRASGRREGGIVGLTEQQASFVSNARAELRDLDAGYFQRKLRDKRFDRTVAKAIRESKPLPETDIARITGRYSDRLLKHRGDTIARTEALRSIHASKHEGFMQGLDATGVRPDQVTRVWRSASDKRVRDTHQALDGTEVQGLDTPFISPSGAALAYPCDPDAPAAESIQCRCLVQYRIRYEAD